MQSNRYFKNRNLFYPKNNVYKFVLIINLPNIVNIFVEDNTHGGKQDLEKQ